MESDIFLFIWKNQAPPGVRAFVWAMSLDMILMSQEDFGQYVKAYI